MNDKQKLREFIQLMQSMNEQEQVGLLMLIQGARLLNKNKKQRITRRFRP